MPIISINEHHKIPSCKVRNMNTSTRALIEDHWHYANARVWTKFSALLHPDLRYEVPQTREYLESGDGYLDLFKTWPGNWTAKIKNLVCEANAAICVIEFVVENDSMTGISVFSIESGLITTVTDYWPEPYEPPPRKSSHLKRRATERKI